MRKIRLCTAEGNILTAYAWRIFVMLLLMSLSRVGFYVFNRNLFDSMDLSELLSAMGGGLVFDLSATAYFQILFTLMQAVPFDIRYNKIYRKISAALFYFAGFIMLSMNGADYVYYRFLGKRATSDIFGTFSNETNLPSLFFRFLFDYWPATLYTIFLTVLMVILYRRFRPVKPKPKNKFVYFGLNFAAMLLILTLFVGAARGGFKHSTRPITISNAARYVENPSNAGIVLNTPFSILRTYGKKGLVKYSFFSENELDSIYNPHKKPSPDEDFKPLNVVVIILESFSKEYTGFFNRDIGNGNYKGFTPFLDSLLTESLTFTASISNGNKSIDAMPSILASMPSLETPYIISHYANNKINGLPFLLKPKGYYSAFFHGAPNGSMGFDSFAKMAGFDDYFGMNEYTGKGEFDGMWGLWDEPFLDFFADKLSVFPQPFMAAVFTLSSHHPFEVPEKYKGVFPTGTIPIHQTIGYADYSLKKFFEKVSVMPWFSNTLFVLTADHTNEKALKEYRTAYGQFSIPIAFYMKGSKLKGTADRIAQQIDIMPSVLDFLNYDSEYIAFGNSVFDTVPEPFGFNTFGSTYYIFLRNHMLESTGLTSRSLYDLKNDRLLENNLVATDTVLKKEMEKRLKAVLQVYNRRLSENDLTVKKD